MPAIKAKITKIIDDSQCPFFVECEFFDANGEQIIIHEKDAVLCASFDPTKVPCDLELGCEILSNDADTIVIVRLKWNATSIDGRTEFKVFRHQLVELKSEQRDPETSSG